MKSVSVQKAARVLNVLVWIALICNLAVLPAVPGLIYFRFATENPITLSGLRGTFAYDFDDGLGNLLNIYLGTVWKEPYTAVLTLFLLFVGICTALILWQALLTLESILRGTPFPFENAHALQKAGFLSFLISFAALARVVFGICFYQSFRPLTTYNALFVPVFAMFGLLCLVMSALFRQAAEMKAESDLTI